MTISLKPGTEVAGEALGRLKVQRKLGEGGQGVVYEVAGAGQTYAFKHYHPDFATPDHGEALRAVIRSGPPKRVARRFIWPLDVAAPVGGRSFGYLMPLIDGTLYAELGQVHARQKPPPDYAAMCEITLQTAESYRELHLTGYCYRDINAGNVWFNTSTGAVLICDNDNVGIDKHSRSPIRGVWEFMPPELVLDRAEPSSATDRHMLAVWLFYLWLWHHPLHGEQEYAIRSWDLIAKKQLYGTAPLFIFHPQDTRNRLPAEYQTPEKRWRALPGSLRGLFTRAFTDGLHDPDARVTDGEWQSLARQLQDTTLLCPACRAVSLWDPSTPGPACWHCGGAVRLPPLAVFSSNGRRAVTLTPGRKLLRRHGDPTASEETDREVLGEVVQNPKSPGVWGIRNHTPDPWLVLLPDGSRKDAPPQRAVPLTLGTTIQMTGACLEITDRP